jgi:hypothetical protein
MRARSSTMRPLRRYEFTFNTQLFLGSMLLEETLTSICGSPVEKKFPTFGNPSFPPPLLILHLATPFTASHRISPHRTIGTSGAQRCSDHNAFSPVCVTAFTASHPYAYKGFIPRWIGCAATVTRGLGLNSAALIMDDRAPQDRIRSMIKAAPLSPIHHSLTLLAGR